MNRSLRFSILVTVVVVGMCLSTLSALAAPPPTPTTPAPSPDVTSPAPSEGAPPIPPSQPWTYPVYHVVKLGENLTRIARYYGTTVWAIAQANGIWNVNYIRAGQVLLIPGWGPGPGPGPGPRYYIVQLGDTLSAIAWRFGTTVWVIAQANGIWNPNLIYVGQRLYIP